MKTKRANIAGGQDIRISGLLPYILLAAGLMSYLFGLSLKPEPGQHDATLQEGSDGFMGIGRILLVTGFIWVSIMWGIKLLSRKDSDANKPTA